MKKQLIRKETKLIFCELTTKIFMGIAILSCTNSRSFQIKKSIIDMSSKEKWAKIDYCTDL